ncbi:hypothetical protein CE91St62_37770 [Lachnospiraceae bacterium]|nr:hypothetical protein CE91St61_37890 [Lachnospiraceae bacterium]BDF39716.1 hypothetical protein CE91St62_37770 [Lachnospiraceae bacterium]
MKEGILLHNNTLILSIVLCIIKMGEDNEYDNKYRTAGKAAHRLHVGKVP